MRGISSCVVVRTCVHANGHTKRKRPKTAIEERGGGMKGRLAHRHRFARRVVFACGNDGANLHTFCCRQRFIGEWRACVRNRALLLSRALMCGGSVVTYFSCPTALQGGGPTHNYSGQTR